MKESVKLTAVVPFHDFSLNFKYLENLLKCVRKNQIEIILICDGLSVEEFNFILRRFECDERISPILVSFGSAAKSRNEGLRRVRTPWVVFWDCDDLINEEGYLETLVGDYANSSDLVIGQLESFDNQSGAKLKATQTLSLSDLATYPAFTRIVYRKSFLQDTNFPDIPLCEDQCFLVQLLVKKPRIHFTQTLLYHYRWNNPNQSSNLLFNVDAHIQGVNFMASESLKPLDGDILRTIKIMKIRLLTSTLKRSRHTTRKNQVILASRIFHDLITSLWLIKYLKPKLLVVKEDMSLPTLILVGGLGNQLFQYVYMLSTFGKLNFQIEGSLGKPRGSHGLPDLYKFNIAEKVFFSKDFMGFKATMANYLLKLSSRGPIDRLSKALFGLVEHVNEIYAIFHKGRKLVFLARGVGYFESSLQNSYYKYYIGCFHSYRWYESVDKKEFHDIVTLKNKPAWLKNFCEKLEREKFGVVHIRRGDYLTVGNLGYLTLNYYETNLNMCIESGLFETFVVFTDDPEYIKSNLNPKFISKSRVIDANLDDSASNLIAMSQGKSFILSNSTFSWWAAALAGDEVQSVVVPKSWYADQRNPLDIYPPTWIISEVI